MEIEEVSTKGDGIEVVSIEEEGREAIFELGMEEETKVVSC